MITNNEVLNQFMNNLKATCADIIVAAHEEAQSGKCDYNRLIELNTKIIDYTNFINLINMEHMIPESAKDSSKKERYIGDVLYVVGLNNKSTVTSIANKFKVFECKVAKIADKGCGKYYTLKGTKSNYVHNYKDSSFGRSVFEDYRSAEEVANNKNKGIK